MNFLLKGYLRDKFYDIFEDIREKLRILITLIMYMKVQLVSNTLKQMRLKKHWFEKDDHRVIPSTNTRYLL